MIVRSSICPSPCEGGGWEGECLLYCQERELFRDDSKILDLLLPLRRGRLGGGLANSLPKGGWEGG